MPTGGIETFHEDATWHNRVEGQTGVLGTHRDKEAAVQAGLAEPRRRHVEHIVKHVEDGSANETHVSTTRDLTRVTRHDE